ncbi:heat-inducible transcriptional repressor HrcA [Lactobacillus sp. PV037]|uniref:heat-inducible transcriptional repressor HrcA n=1 Tax=Lactobacillus sp. PV037 TaxID=2594496 RepID=UPI0022400CCF|nr:heat-inducible transcriptional repressor HrcA [Lactobacillus sp. PV037]QNQ83829.1 heat-inducible transcriptional repressor HrcA [Lactobacillus sp. PV037]
MLTKRQELILKMIIQDFAQTNEPVGSKTVMTQLPIKVSSATIRNEMAVLEEKGLLEKTHSSSGRIPSSDGYRYYLDNLVDPVQIPTKVYDKIGLHLDQPFSQVNQIVQEAAKILSDLTNYTAFAAGPETDGRLITGFRIVTLSARQVMAILVTDDGNVKNQIYSLPTKISGQEIEEAVSLINKQVVGKPVTAINQAMMQEIGQHLLLRGSSPEVLKLLEDVIKDSLSEELYVDGQINLFNNSENKDVRQIKSLYELLDKNDEICRLIGLSSQSPDSHRVQVTLGSDLPSSLLDNYSLLTAHYTVGKYGRGTIALLGPTNMPYSQMIGLLDSFRTELAQKLLDYYGRLN